MPGSTSAPAASSGGGPSCETARRKAHPGGGAGHALDEEGWDRFARNLAVAAARIRARGLEPTFHHLACTFVETPEEVDIFL